MSAIYTHVWGTLESHSDCSITLINREENDMKTLLFGGGGTDV